MIAWMAYAALVGGVVAVAGLAMERLAAATGRPRRIAWLAAMTLAVVIPPAGGWHRTAPKTVAAHDGTPGPAVVAGGPTEDFWSAMPTLPLPRVMASGRIALLAWVAGSLASLAVLGGVLMLVARRRRRWDRRWVGDRVVYVSRRFGPALVGVARPEVVLPAWVLQLEPRAREAIIRHELEHARARDHLVLLCGGLAVAAFPWSPAIWWMYRRLRAAVELDCDQRVLASGIGVADYGDVLLNAGCRSTRRWGFAPAMGQPRSLLERRLKTMSEERRKPNAGATALLAAVAVGAVVVACDTPVPTEVREAFEEVTADQGVPRTEAETEQRRVRLLLLRDFVVTGRSRDFGPLVYLDGVRVPGPWESDGEDPLSRLDPDDIVRVEVLKGPAAAKLYGEEAASGVIEVFTEEAEPVDELVAAPSVGEFVVTDVVTGPEGEESEVEVPVEGLVVTGLARAGVEFRVEELVATVRPTDWKLWLAKYAVTGTPPGWDPVIYVDDVRVDGGGPGLDRLSPATVAHRIDRIDVLGGRKVLQLYGGEGVHGVIRIYTKK